MNPLTPTPLPAKPGRGAFRQNAPQRLLALVLFIRAIRFIRGLKSAPNLYCGSGPCFVFRNSCFLCVFVVQTLLVSKKQANQCTTPDARGDLSSLRKVARSFIPRSIRETDPRSKRGHRVLPLWQVYFLHPSPPRRSPSFLKRWWRTCRRAF
jgi:hypothetical protein